MRKAAIVAMLALLASLLMVVPALADHDLVTLPGSNFEIDADANLLTEDDPPSIDWDAVAQEGKDDAPTGQNDDSFGQGTKEDTAVPTIVDGSIPNNKSDLKSFGSYFEENANGKFLNLYWTRVQDPTGTTNMDFELNQSEQLSGNGVTPVPTAGDALIQYDLASGGTHPELFLSLWVTTGAGSLCEASNKTPCWGDRVNLTSQDLATGSINTTPIPAGAAGDGVGPLSARTFGEAQVDFDAFTSGGGGSGDPCVSFASAYLKSRSSDSFTAALKDFIAPDTLDIGNCGLIKIIKTDDATPPAKLAGAEFDLLKDNAPVGGQPGAEDTFVDDCVTDANGECTFASVVQGSYWVVETLAPTGHDLPSPPYQEVTVVADEQVTVTFVNPRQLGAIQVTKTAKHAAAAGGEINQSGVAFTIAGTAVTTGNDGTACVGGLALGQSYDVVETVPAGYAAEGETTKSVLVDQAGTCVAGFETVEFVNLPLTDITFSVESQIDGGTASDITCDDPNNPPGNESTATTDANGDGSLTVDDLEPSTYTCTVVIDP
jgi:Prealbumin-like fold domain